VTLRVIGPATVQTRGVTTVTIDGYVDTLAARLRGSRRLTDDVVTEVRDGLQDAARAYTDGGLPPAAAERRAVTEFGSVEELAAQFQRTVAVAQGRSTARLLALGMPLAVLVSGWGWRYLHPDSAVGAMSNPPGDYHAAVSLVDLFGYGTGAVFAVLWLLIGPMARWVVLPSWLPRATAGCALLFVGASTLAGLALTVVSLRWSPQSALSWSMLLSAVVWGTVLCASMRATRSLLFATS
jgi:hypothetical protein